MDTSLFLARLIGPVLLTISAAMLINPANMREMANDFLEHRGLIFLAGILALLGGLAIVLTHNVWEWRWTVIITIFGWLSVIGGIFRIVFPDSVKSIGQSMLDKPRLITGAAIVEGLIGAWLCYVGFMAA
jgi:4-amino-4-deoxy-L-arabinose transferase-like glycosyltransferase